VPQDVHPEIFFLCDKSPCTQEYGIRAILCLQSQEMCRIYSNAIILPVSVPEFVTRSQIKGAELIAIGVTHFTEPTTFTYKYIATYNISLLLHVSAADRHFQSTGAFCQEACVTRNVAVISVLFKHFRLIYCLVGQKMFRLPYIHRCYLNNICLIYAKYSPHVSVSPSS
jgi:hypothetical protein